jgi:WD40 repeat protein
MIRLATLIVTVVPVFVWSQFALAGDLLVVNVPSASIKNILRFDPATGQQLGVFVSTGSGGLGWPGAMTYGPDGNLYVAEVNASPTGKINKYDGQSGVFLSVFATNIILSSVYGMAFGPDGNLYTHVSAAAGRVGRWNGQTGAYMGAFTAAAGGVTPHDVVFGPGNSLYVSTATSSFGSVARFSATTGAFQGIIAQPTMSSGVKGVAFTASDLLLFTAYEGHWIFKGASPGTTTFANTVSPSGIRMGPGDRVYACSNAKVVRYESNGTPAGLPANPSNPIIISNISGPFLQFMPDAPPEPTTGNLNCDNAVDVDDIEPFVLAMLDPAGYQAAHPGCDILRADVNGDGRVDGGDVKPFKALLLGQ